MEGLGVCNIFLDTTMAKKNLGQFLLIQQFWLMGTTSIPQPVITTAQFPISALLARKSSFGRQFSAISQLVLSLFLESMWANMKGGVNLTLQQVTWQWHQIITSLLTLHPSHLGQWMWENCLRLKYSRQRTYLSVLFHSLPPVWLTACTRLGGSTQSPGNWPFPFPRMSL